jgi:hypothetical protein
VMVFAKTLGHAPARAEREKGAGAPSV